LEEVLSGSIKTQSGQLISNDLCERKLLEIPAQANIHPCTIKPDDGLCLKDVLTWLCKESKEDR